MRRCVLGIIEIYYCMILVSEEGRFLGNTDSETSSPLGARPHHGYSDTVKNSFASRNNASRYLDANGDGQ